jgi:hypothetical protein
MSLLWEAAAEFVEIMAMRDVMADIGELTAEEFIEPFRGASIKKGMKFLAKNKVKSAGGASAVIGALGLPGAISAIDHHRKAARAGTARAAANGQSLSYMPSRPHRSFSLYRKSMAGKRKYMSPGHTLGIRPGYRGGKRRKVYRKQDATRFDAKARNYNARGSVSTNSGIAVVKKLSLAPNPTNTAAGGALDFIITNQKLKTVPDGQGGFSWNFSLSQFPQYTEYTDLYQWYKLLWVKITFYPEQNSYDSFESTGIQVGDTPTKIQGVSPIIVVCPDKTSDAVFSTINEAMAHHDSTLHSFNDGKEFTVFLSPKPNSLVGNAGGEVQTLSSGNKWITTASTGVEHYGLRCFIDRMTANSSIYCVMEMKVAFKEPKT